MKKKRFTLPKRFKAAVSEVAYARLRSLNDEYGWGNNYLLTILLEHLDEYADPESLARVFQNFKDEFGAPEKS